MENNLKINLCCGGNYREGYLNVDFSDLRSDKESIKVDLNFDVRKKLPWDDNSVSEIVFRESLEHFNRWDGLNILKEIYRVLKPGGKLDLTVPPAQKQMKILLQMMSRNIIIEDFLDAHGRFSPIKYVDDLMGATHETLIDGVDKGQGDSHKMLFTKQWLECILKYVGFKIVKIDDNIFVEARKE